MLWEQQAEQKLQSIPLLLSQAMVCTGIQLADGGERLKSPLLSAKHVYSHQGQLSFLPAVGMALLPQLRQINPPLRFILRKVVHAYACNKPTRNIIFKF